MKKNSKKVSPTQQYDEGGAPQPSAMLGPKGEPARWSVKMLTGLIPDMGGWPFYHYKAFAGSDEVCGCNVFHINVFVRFALWLLSWLFYFDGRWGNFRLEDKGDHLLVNYDVSENSWLTKRIRDHIRTTDDPNVMIGKFHMMIRGREIFLGYFTLTRIVETEGA